MTLLNSLPGEFPFYHLGTVTPADLSADDEALFEAPADLESEGLSAVAFSLYGEYRAVAVVLFDSRLDRATYTEMGNTLASQLADRLAVSRGLVMISPPVSLSPAQFRTLRTSGGKPTSRLYLHPRQAAAPARVWLAVFESPSLKEEWSA